jgi:hypothetical protein
MLVQLIATLPSAASLDPDFRSQVRMLRKLHLRYIVTLGSPSDNGHAFAAVDVFEVSESFLQTLCFGK